jgi:hypothetical protein
MNKTEWVKMAGEALRWQMPPGMNFVLVCQSLDSAGRCFWQSESNNRPQIVALLRGYLSALEKQERFNQSAEMPE